MSKEDRKVEVPFEEALAEIMSKTEGEGETERGERERGERERVVEVEYFRWDSDGISDTLALL
jgi:hypothetical protein